MREVPKAIQMDDKNFALAVNLIEQLAEVADSDLKNRTRVRRTTGSRRRPCTKARHL
jgi:hypothetical protein